MPHIVSAVSIGIFTNAKSGEQMCIFESIKTLNIIKTLSALIEDMVGA